MNSSAGVVVIVLHPVADTDTTPWLLTCRHWVPELPSPETVSAVVDALVVTERMLVVAFVVVEFTITRLVMVDDAAFARMPPFNVESADTVRVPPMDALFETVRAEVDARVVTARYEVVAFVVVEFVYVNPALRLSMMIPDESIVFAPE